MWQSMTSRKVPLGKTAICWPRRYMMMIVDNKKKGGGPDAAGRTQDSLYKNVY